MAICGCLGGWLFVCIGTHGCGQCAGVRLVGVLNVHACECVCVYECVYTRPVHRRLRKVTFKPGALLMNMPNVLPLL